MASDALLESFFRGDTVDWTVYETDENGDRVDIAGFRYVATLKEDIDLPDSEAAWQIVVDVPDNQGVIHEWPMVVKAQPAAGDPDPPPAGTPPDHNRDTDPGTYRFDLVRVLNGDPPHRTTLVSQKVKVRADVTRDY